jgi:hypothetical protein
MKKIIVACVVVLVCAAFAGPFAADVYSRIKVSQKLDRVLTEQDQKAFQAWNGDARSFVKALNARCELENGQGSATCDRYRAAVE